MYCAKLVENPSDFYSQLKVRSVVTVKISEYDESHQCQRIRFYRGRIFKVEEDALWIAVFHPRMSEPFFISRCDRILGQHLTRTTEGRIKQSLRILQYNDLLPEDVTGTEIVFYED